MKNKIYINPPPSNLNCERCNRPFYELPLFINSDRIKAIEPIVGPHAVVDKKKDVRLVKTYRSFCDQISASWECQDCINMPDIDDIVGQHLEENTMDDFYKWLDYIILAGKNAIKADKKVFEFDNQIYSVNVVSTWIKTVELYGKNNFEQTYKEYQELWA